MKSICVLAAMALASISALAQVASGEKPTNPLRSALLQKPGAAKGSARRLSDEERAELRRQVLQVSRQTKAE